MRIGIYKDTLANRRGADVAILALAEGLQERAGVESCELGIVSDGVGDGYKNGCVEQVGLSEVVVFDKKDFEKRIKEQWDVIISTGTNELLDLHRHFPSHHSPTPSLTHSSTHTLTHFPFPVIQQFHTNPKSQFKWKRFIRNWKIRRALRRVSAIQVLNERFISQVEKYGVPVHVIGNWSKYSLLRVKSLELSVNSQLITHNSQLPSIIYPAAFSKGKNQKLLIKAFAQVAAKFPDWRLRLLGHADGAYADACRRLAVKVGVADKVEFPGFCENLAEEYAHCAFVAFPSRNEGFPLVLAESAAFAKPCVMVEDWIGSAAAGGGIVAKSTVKAYSGGLKRLMESVDLRHRMGENAREFCAEHFSRERILDQWETLIDETVAANRSTRSDNLPHDKKA